MVSLMFPTPNGRRKCEASEQEQMVGYWVRSLPTHRTPTIFIFAISLRGVVVAKIPVIVVCTAPGVPNGALGGVSGGVQGGCGGVWGRYQ